MQDLNTSINEETTCYKCKKCRTKLFESNQILTHISGSGEKARPLTDEADQDICPHEFYIESLTWFANKLEEIKGKINCPKCDAKLGSFDWCGTICSCYAWITPAFHIATNKVDICRPFKDVSQLKSSD